MREASLAALKMDDVLYIVGSLCVGLAFLALSVMFYIVLRRRGSEPSRAYERPALPGPMTKREDGASANCEFENDDRNGLSGIGEEPDVELESFEEES